MRWNQEHGIHWLSSDLLEGVAHGFFAKLDVGRDTDTLSVEAAENRKQIASALNVDKVVTGKQIHSNCVAIVDRHSPPLVEGYDALITQEKGLGLFIKHGDCQAALFYDPVQEVIANVHCGWRGAVANIYREAVECVHASFGCDPSDIRVAISPSLGPRRFEFKSYRDDLPPEFWIHRQGDYFDFWAIAQEQLQELGIQRIEIANICSYESPDFFSHRGDKSGRRNGTMIARC